MNRSMAGFSLVELLVALLLGGLITLAAVQLLVTNQRTFITQQTVSRVQEDGQLALRFLANDLRQAGYTGGPAGNDSGVVFGGANGSEDGNPYDRLTIRFVGTQDCQGSTVIDPDSPEVITNSYAVNANGELTCQGSLTGGAPVALLPGVAAFRVLYGVDTKGEVDNAFGVEPGSSGDNSGPGPFSVMNAASASVAESVDGSRRPIVSIKFALLLEAESPSLPESNMRNWSAWDRVTNAGGDRVIRRMFYSTVMLRNLNRETL